MEDTDEPEPSFSTAHAAQPERSGDVDIGGGLKGRTEGEALVTHQSREDSSGDDFIDPGPLPSIFTEEHDDYLQERSISEDDPDVPGVSDDLTQPMMSEMPEPPSSDTSKNRFSSDGDLNVDDETEETLKFSSRYTTLPELDDSLSLPHPPMLLDDEPSGLFEAVVPASAPVSAPASSEPSEPQQAASAGFWATDIARMFKGYVVMTSREGVITFGLMDERSLRDAHSYPEITDSVSAYKAFLMDKMREGFVPQVHLTKEIGDVWPIPLDMASLEQAYLQMMGR
jgi:hypothetical protein